jgi:hypothetical protein
MLLVSGAGNSVSGVGEGGSPPLYLFCLVGFRITIVIVKTLFVFYYPIEF